MYIIGWLLLNESSTTGVEITVFVGNSVHFRNGLESANVSHIWFGEWKTQNDQSISASQPKSSSYFLHTRLRPSI